VVSIVRWWNTTCRFCRVIDRFLSVAVRVTFLVLALYGGYLVITWWQDTSAVAVYGLGEASATTARPNEVIIFYQHVKKLRNCMGTIQRILIGECGFFIISEAPAWILAPWEGRLTYAVQIPHEAIPGDCGFQIVGRYFCNPVDYFGTPRIVESTPIPFQVLRYDQ
jgi:hypothetical protein